VWPRPASVSVIVSSAQDRTQIGRIEPPRAAGTRAAGCDGTKSGRSTPCVGVLMAAVVGGCASLPPLDMRSAGHAIEAPAGSGLRAGIEPLAARHPDQSGIYPLKDGPGALAARVALVTAAVSSIDVQYYIWHDDTTGGLM